jgi:hypothetical protein
LNKKWYSCYAPQYDMNSNFPWLMTHMQSKFWGFIHYNMWNMWYLLIIILHNITTLCWFYYITYYHMENHLLLYKNASINAPSFGLILVSNVNINVPLPHQQTWILNITLLWHHLNIYSCQSLWSTLKIIGVGC